METIQNKLLSFSVDSDGIGTLVINQTEESTNLFSEAFIIQYIEVAQQAIADENVKGVIVTSGKPIFMAGADLRALLEDITDKKAFTDSVINLHTGLRSIETGGKPFVAAINGTALGGGLELCLACHHRIALNSTKIKIGFPEIKVGLFPGGGGTVKAPYLLGIQTALMYLLQGIEARPQKALKDGLIDAVAETEEEMLAAAKAFILATPNPVQPWDNKRHKIPGGGIWTPNGIQTLAGASGNVGKLTHGNYPSAQKIVKVIHDGLQIPIDRALEVEARNFTHAVCSKEAKNMIRTGFFAIQDAAKGKARPKDQPKYEINKLGVLGAGMMGAGIAYVSAKAGMDVVLKDVSLEGAEKGKSYSTALLDKAIAKKRSTPEKKEALLAKITPTDNPNAVEGSDLIIEAVFENVDLKDRVTKETEAVLAEDKIYGSNTSTIPISLLAKSSKRPENFIGIHFFSPVDKMPLVEIIVGEKTEDKAIAAAVDYTVAIKKVPIVVNDSRGFFTSRCFGTFVSEGMFLLEEGVPAPMLERIATKIGMPVGPLAVHDEVSLTLSVHIFESDPAEKQESEKRTYAIVKNLVENHNRTGKRDGAGFYDYPKGGQKKLWPGLKEIFTPNLEAVSEETITKRLLSRQVLESYRCLDEGVLRSSTDGDIGSILGWGFPIFTGGALSYIDYVGMDNFIADCDVFKTAYGAHWEVPQSLRALAAAGKSIHDFGK
ncbi:3-hydroxyacyl-CoA dehydrogenase NAD-binding domain-containing protein [Flavobacteriaceae bacterium]|nr:3-hydroxyacyl-CoA dehydrogenase NAD-binding domain-containing protein [Flavobacteriaceae bacterium]